MTVVAWHGASSTMAEGNGDYYGALTRGAGVGDMGLRYPDGKWIGRTTVTKAEYDQMVDSNRELTATG